MTSAIFTGRRGLQYARDARHCLYYPKRVLHPSKRGATACAGPLKKEGFAVDALVRPHTWCGTRVDPRGWIDAMSKIGLSCRFDPSHFGESTAEYEQAADMLIGRLELAGQ